MSRLATASRRNRFVILRTAGSPPVAPHPASQRRSYLRLWSCDQPQNGLAPFRQNVLEDALITGLDPVIHLLRKNLLRRWMDARIKSGHDERVLSSTPLSRDAESLETVIASQQVANARPMTGSASKSMAVIPGWSAGPDPESRDSGFDASHRPGMTAYGLLRRLRSSQWRTSNSAYDFAPRREAPEPLINLPPIEGVGNAGCPLHPRPRVHFVVVERTRVTTSTPESPGIPARNGFNGFLRALPGDRALLPPSHADMSCLSPVGPT